MRKLSSFLLESVKKPKREATGHLVHVSDRLFHGNADDALNSLRSMFSRMNNEEQEGHDHSVKADGGMSVVFGKEPEPESYSNLLGRSDLAARSAMEADTMSKAKARHFVAYKGLKELFYTHSDIVKSGKDHYVRTLGPLLKRAKGMDLEPGTAYQADMLHTNRGSDTFTANTTRYKTPEQGSIGVALHKKLRVSGDDFVSERGTPDSSEIQHDDVFTPNLSLRGKKFKKMKKSRHEAISRDMGLADELTSNDDFKKFANGLPENKKFHTMLQAYSNKEARESGQLSMDGFRKFIPNYIDKRKVGIKTKHKEHIDHHNLVNDNEDHFDTLFGAHNASTSAMHGMLDHLRDNHHVTELEPHEDHEHEGLVHTDEKGNMHKFVRRGPEGFAAKNAARTAELRGR